MEVHICGVRGSTSSPGGAFVRYGGNTSCVAIAPDGGVPTLVLDAGTGLRRLSALLGGRPFQGTILLGHLHWDHTHGLPFFAAGDTEESVVSVLLPAQGVDPVTLLERFMSPPHFPIRPAELLGAWTFGEIDEGRHEIEGFSVVAMEIPHKGGRTFGYRVEDGRTSIAYLSDHCPTALGPGPDGLGDLHDAALTLAAGVDILIHDAQYTADELRNSRSAGFGHSSPDYAVALGRRCGVGQVLLFHHDPPRTDDDIDALVVECGSRGVPVEGAREGQMFSLPRAADGG